MARLPFYSRKLRLRFIGLREIFKYFILNLSDVDSLFTDTVPVSYTFKWVNLLIGSTGKTKCTFLKHSAFHMNILCKFCKHGLLT